MPELFDVDDAAKVRVFARPEVLDGLAVPPGLLRGRIAPEELVLVGPVGSGSTLVAQLEEALSDEGPAALVVDHTDGWSLLSLVGEDAEEVWARVSHVPLPPANDEPVFVMGRVCDVAGKAFRRAGRVDLMTGAEVREHVWHRLEAAGHALGLRAVPRPTENPLSTTTPSSVEVAR